MQPPAALPIRVPADTAGFNKGAAISCALHAIVFIGIPVLLHFAQSPARLERPPTFQLVNVPPSIKPAAIKQTLASRKASPRSEKQAVPRQENEPEAKPEENLDELNSVLDELPSPARVAAVGAFKYNWYLAQVQEKVERYWNPSTSNRNDSVVVAFVIHSDGSINEPSLEKASENQTLNDLALRAVKLGAPFAKLPPGVQDNQYEMTCTLRPTKK